ATRSSRRVIPEPVNDYFYHRSWFGSCCHPFERFFDGLRDLFASAPMLAMSSAISSENSANGRSRSSVAWPAPSVSTSCHAAGPSNAPLPGLIVTAASPKTSRRQSLAPKPWLYLSSLQLLIR